MTRNFRKHLVQSASSSNVEPNSDFFHGTVDNFLALAARSLHADGIELETIAHLYVSAAHELLSRTGGMNLKEAGEKIIAIANQFDEDVFLSPSGKPNN